MSEGGEYFEAVGQRHCTYVCTDDAKSPFHFSFEKAQVYQRIVDQFIVSFYNFQCKVKDKNVLVIRYDHLFLGISSIE